MFLLFRSLRHHLNAMYVRVRNWRVYSQRDRRNQIRSHWCTARMASSARLLLCLVALALTGNVLS